MRDDFRPRFKIPIYQAAILGLITLSCLFYIAHKDLAKKLSLQSNNTMMTISPIVPTFDFKKKPVIEPVVKEIVIDKNETFSELMEDQGFDAAMINQIYEGAKDVYNLARIRAGKTLVITMSPDNKFSKLEYSIDPFQKLVVSSIDETIKAEVEKYSAEVQIGELGGEIYGSLYSTIERLGEEDELVIRFAEIFEWDVDFFKDLQAGDTFRIVFEKQYIKGEPLGYGRILAAELNNKGKLYQALGYEHGKTWDYFSPDGKAMKKAFLASPLKFTRISSGFTTRRYHPILKRYRPHYGIDYAAPAGTPVRAIGKGRVTLAGWAGGAGKTVKIQHDRDITTVYCHLSRFAPGVRSGASISQGQVIGYVGSTGLATAPHLDFRFLQKGKYVNFLKVKTPQAEPLSAKEVAEFRSATAGMLNRLQAIAIQPKEREVAQFSPANFGSVQLTESIQ